MVREKQVQIIASDAGGTMTDMMVVDTEGNFSKTLWKRSKPRL